MFFQLTAFIQLKYLDIKHPVGSGRVIALFTQTYHSYVYSVKACLRILGCLNICRYSDSFIVLKGAKIFARKVSSAYRNG